MAKKSVVVEEDENTLHPKFAETLVAHQEIERQLLGMFTANTLPHALLFSGPRGVGKATLAYRLARFLLAPPETGGGLFGDPLPPESFAMSPSHPTFRRIVAGSHPDILVLEAEDIKVEDARAVSAFLSLTPAESAWRVVIIDSIDAMNRSAANALLKTLEEPPSQAVLILISHNPGSLLPTIRSRCRKIRIAPLPPLDFSRVMATIRPDIDVSESQVLALLSNDSPGVALQLYDAHAPKLYKELCEVVVKNDVLKLYSFAERFARKDSDRNFQVLTRLIVWMLPRIVSPQLEHSPEVFDGEREMLSTLRTRKPLESWLELCTAAAELISDTVRLHLDRKQMLVNLLRAFGA